MVQITYDKWAKNLDALNDKINGLKVWDDYAERLQSRYDEMLREDPRLKENK